MMLGVMDAADAFLIGELKPMISWSFILLVRLAIGLAVVTLTVAAVAAVKILRAATARGAHALHDAAAQPKRNAR
jgi:hypothetical protein